MSTRPPDPGRRQLWIDFEGVRTRLPYITAWSSEAASRVAAHRELGPMIVASGQRGWGSPVLGQMDFHRQRRVVAQGWCRVCADTLQDGPRWLLPLGATRVSYESEAGAIEETLRIREPWACRGCTAEAIEADESISFAIKAKTWHTELTAIDARPLAPPDRRTFDGEVVDSAIGYAVIVPLLFAVIERGDFLTSWARITERRGH